MQQVGLEILDILMPSTIIEVVEHIQITFLENIIWLIHTWRLIRKHFQHGSFRKQINCSRKWLQICQVQLLK
jgi:uncharacterized protein YqhQ